MQERTPMRFRSAIAALMATALMASLGLVAAQAPDCATDRCVYLPLMEKPPDTPTPTHTPTLTPTLPPPPPTRTPTLPPPTYNGCQSEPNPGSAPDYPVRVVTVFKSAVPEVVRLQNTSAAPVSLDGWHMCSMHGSQLHEGVGGVIAPGETRDYPYTGSNFIWNNTLRDDGALYTPDGRLASYWTDPT